MRLRLGTTLDGHPAHLDTRIPGLTLVIGDPGTGKTTLARHITRWWLAETAHRVQLLAGDPHEWHDLLAHTEPVTAADPQAFASGHATQSSDATATVSHTVLCHDLVVIDPFDSSVGLFLDETVAHTTAARPANTPSHTGSLMEARSDAPHRPLTVDQVSHLARGHCVIALTTTDVTLEPELKVRRYALLPVLHRAGHRPRLPLDADAAQGRLDWGDAMPLLPDTRGPHDFPRHRWDPGRGNEPDRDGLGVIKASAAPVSPAVPELRTTAPASPDVATTRAAVVSRTSPGVASQAHLAGGLRMCRR